METLFHFNGTEWKPALLVTRDGDESVLRMLDNRTYSIRHCLEEIQDKNLTSEVSDSIRGSFQIWSAYVLSWLHENRAFLNRLHKEFEERMEKKRSENAERWAQRHQEIHEQLAEMKKLIEEM